MVFCEKWLRNHPQFLLHFLIHIDVLMLCRKFEMIPTSIFQVMTIFKNWLKCSKIMYIQVQSCTKNVHGIWSNFENS